MSIGLAITPSEDAMSQLPRMPVGSDGKATYEKLLDAVEQFLAQNDPAQIRLQDLADATETPTASVNQFFPNPESAAAALTLRYVEIAAVEIMTDQSATGAEGWQGIVNGIFRRGREFYAKYPAAMKLRLGGAQSAGVRHVVLQSTWTLAAVIKSELERLFVIPPHADLENELTYAIVICDALWSLSVELHGEITDDLASEAERAVSALLEPNFGSLLRLR